MLGRLLPLVLLFLLSLSGCVPLYYAYPSVSYIPEIELASTPSFEREDPAPVHVFRVEVKDDQNTIEFPEDDRYVLREEESAYHYDSWLRTGNPMTWTGYSYVPAQFQFALDTGMIWNCIALIYEKHTRHSIRLRLYRSGYQTVEIKPGDKLEGRINWKAATEAAAQEKAADDLLTTQATAGPMRSHDPVTDLLGSLAAGSVSGEHRKALQFAATEYERLADRNFKDEDLQRRCRAKAAWLRERAGK